MSGNWDFKIYVPFVKVPSSAFIKLAAPPRMAKILPLVLKTGFVVLRFGSIASQSSSPLVLSFIIFPTSTLT